MNYNNAYTSSGIKRYNNIVIRTLYAPEYSSLMMSFYKTHLTFAFSPYSGKNESGFPQYDIKRHVSTTVDHEGAAALYLIVKKILQGDEMPTRLILPRYHQATLTFKYEPDESNQMRAYLLLDKNRETIPFQFAIHQYQVKENGQVVTKTIQSGLMAFEKVLEAYLTSTDAAKYLNKSAGEGDSAFGVAQQSAPWL